MFPKSVLRLLSSSWSSVPIPARTLHSNRAAVCRLKRAPGEYCRMYPVRIVFKDGSTIVSRHQLPREIIKLPLQLEDCKTERERMEWRSRRKQKEVIKIKKDDTDVQFDRSQYLKAMKGKNLGSKR